MVVILMAMVVDDIAIDGYGCIHTDYGCLVHGGCSCPAAFYTGVDAL